MYGTDVKTRTSLSPQQTRQATAVLNAATNTMTYTSAAIAVRLNVRDDDMGDISIIIGTDEWDKVTDHKRARSLDTIFPLIKDGSRIRVDIVARCGDGDDWITLNRKAMLPKVAGYVMENL